MKKYFSSKLNNYKQTYIFKRKLKKLFTLMDYN